MTVRWKVVIWTAAVVALTAVTSGIAIRVYKNRRITLRGAVIREDSDPNKESPIANVQITATTGSVVSNTTSDSSGFFSITLPRGFRRRQPVALQFRHAEYRPLDLSEFIADKLYLVHLQPASNGPETESPPSDVLVSNLRIRYSAKIMMEADVGSAVRTFQIPNTGNVACAGRHPCSPDGKWKAALGSVSLDAGEGNEFRNTRVACLAGPCPFARVEHKSLSRGGRILDVAVRNWSDTVTFLLEAEVVHPMVSDMVRESYPVVFGQTMTFTLPDAAEGPSIEAEINSEAIVFPIGPDLFLSWARCTLGLSEGRNRIYACELKPGYRFR